MSELLVKKLPSGAVFESPVYVCSNYAKLVAFRTETSSAQATSGVSGLTIDCGGVVIIQRINGYVKEVNLVVFS